MSTMKPASRINHITPFYVMDLLAKAKELEAQGRNIIHLEIGEPDFSTSITITNACVESLKKGLTHYTPSLGLPELRGSIAQFYKKTYKIDINENHIAITPGASGALQLVLGALLNVGDEVLMADPGYPCNRNFVKMLGGVDVNIPVNESSNYQLTTQHIEKHINANTRAVLIASPSNPTGTLISDQELDAIHTLCERRNLFLIVDEIYMGLTYSGQEHSATRYTNVDNHHVFVINSFSKYFGMTGMRVGWLIAPSVMMDAIDRQAQNFFLAASTTAQYGALAALSTESEKEIKRRRDVFRQRRDYLLPELREMGFIISTEPNGAFYLYADCSKFTTDSFQFCFDVLEHTGVAVTPGKDFGANKPEQFVRFAYTRDISVLKTAVERLKNYLNAY